MCSLDFGEIACNKYPVLLFIIINRVCSEHVIQFISITERTYIRALIAAQSAHYYDGVL